MWPPMLFLLISITAFGCCAFDTSLLELCISHMLYITVTSVAAYTSSQPFVNFIPAAGPFYRDGRRPLGSVCIQTPVMIFVIRLILSKADLCLHTHP